MVRKSSKSAAKLRDILGPVLPVTCVDIGARNGPTDIKGISDICATYCFEPNTEEFEKLANTVSAIGEPPSCGDVRSFPAAVCGYDGTATLNISRRPGATSTLVPDKTVLEQFSADNWSEMSDIVSRIEVPAVTLETFAATNKLAHIDFLKLDTQGNELDILRAAGDILDHVAVIKTEVEFIPLYKGQALFDEVAIYLRSRGFELVDIEQSTACRRFHRFDHLRPSAYRLVWADLVMVRKPLDADDPRALAKATVLAAMGYVDFACHIVNTVFAVNPTLCSAFEEAALDMLAPVTFAARVRNISERLLGVLMSRYDWGKGQQVASLR